jgi:phosphopantothenate synthetase
MPDLITKIKKYKDTDKKTLEKIINKYDNKKILLEAITKIRNIKLT